VKARIVATNFAYGAYAAAARATASPRALELQAFSQITAALAAAVRSGSHPDLIAALSHNQRLWTTLAADVAEPGNALPARLRAQIFQLADFIRAHTRRIVNGDGASEPGVLVEINLNVMKGLRAEAAP
jgi:flagellar protein FlaF